MKKIMFVGLIVIALVVVILRINLPQNDVSNYFTDDHEMSIFEKKMVELMLNDAVAEWQYIDLVVVKFACSEKLKITFIGLPFRRWSRYDKENLQFCG